MESGIICLSEFIEKNFKGLTEEKIIADLSGKNLDGIMVEGNEIYLTPFYKRDTEFFYHQGIIIRVNPPRFNNTDNLREGFFGKKDGFTYIATDKLVKPSMPQYDVSLKISAKQLNQPVYRDPESLLKKFEYEYGRAFMIEGPIPKEAIVECTLCEPLRWIDGLFTGPINFEKCFEKIADIRKEFSGLINN